MRSFYASFWQFVYRSATINFIISRKVGKMCHESLLFEKRMRKKDSEISFPGKAEPLLDARHHRWSFRSSYLLPHNKCTTMLLLAAR